VHGVALAALVELFEGEGADRVEEPVPGGRGGPVDDDEDLGLPMWAGVLPCALTWGEPVADALLPEGRPVSPSVLARRNGH